MVERPQAQHDVARCRNGANDSKSANVNDLGLACTSWPPSLHGPALLLVPTVFPPGGLLCP